MKDERYFLAAMRLALAVNIVINGALPQWQGTRRLLCTIVRHSVLCRSLQLLLYDRIPFKSLKRYGHPYSYHRSSLIVHRYGESFCGAASST